MVGFGHRWADQPPSAKSGLPVRAAGDRTGEEECARRRPPTRVAAVIAGNWPGPADDERPARPRRLERFFGGDQSWEIQQGAEAILAAVE